MRMIQRIISVGFATAALASASMPALSGTVWPNVDFEWYANVGEPYSGSTVEVFPAPREGQIWVPGHYERRGASTTWVEGRWIADDYDQQVATHSVGPGETFATGPTELRDREGNTIPTDPRAYPVDSARR